MAPITPKSVRLEIQDSVATLLTAHGGHLECRGVAGGADLLSDEGEVGSDGSTLNVLLLGGVVRLGAPLVAPVLALVASHGIMTLHVTFVTDMVPSRALLTSHYCSTLTVLSQS